MKLSVVLFRSQQIENTSGYCPIERPESWDSVLTFSFIEIQLSLKLQPLLILLIQVFIDSYLLIPLFLPGC